MSGTERKTGSGTGNKNDERPQKRGWTLFVDAAMGVDLLLLLATGVAAPQVHTVFGLLFIVLLLLHGVPSYRHKKRKRAAALGPDAPKKRPTRIIALVVVLLVCVMSGHTLLRDIIVNDASALDNVLSPWGVVHILSACYVLVFAVRHVRHNWGKLTKLMGPSEE